MSEVTPEWASQLRDNYLQQLEIEQKTFLNVVKAMPDGKLDYKPHEKVMGFAELARHTAGSGAFFVKLIETGEADMSGPPPAQSTPATTAELVAELETALAATKKAFEDFSPEQMAKPVDFCGMGAHPGVQYLNWDLVHLIHHRAQLGMYLRMADEKVPAIYGPSADVSFEDMMAEG